MADIDVFGSALRVTSSRRQLDLRCPVLAVALDQQQIHFKDTPTWPAKTFSHALASRLPSLRCVFQAN